MPPEFQDHWERAVARIAIKSSCAKSKRGVGIFDQRGNPRAMAFNAPPPGYVCGGDEACEAVCNRVAVHAEERAIIRAGRQACRSSVLVHLKVDSDGLLVSSGPPSCWQCSRMIVEAQIATVWLFHERGWAPYTAEEFHDLTLAQCRLPIVKAPVQS